MGKKLFLTGMTHFLKNTCFMFGIGGGHYSSGSGVRNVVKEQHTRIAHLERTIMAMRQRREWGDDSLIGGLSRYMTNTTQNLSSSIAFTLRATIGSIATCGRGQSSVLFFVHLNRT